MTAKYHQALAPIKNFFSKLTKKPLILLLLLLTFSLAVAGWLYYTRSGNKVTITIADRKFTPDFISIPVGTTVTWVNRGDRPHWPASDIHPTHNEYPSQEPGCLGSLLDACRGLDKDEHYSFTFENIGNWGIHDHLYPDLTMIIEVVEFTSVVKKHTLEAGSPEQNHVELPTPESFRALSYQEQLNIIKTFSAVNPKLVWKYLEKVYLEEDQVVATDSSWLDYTHVFAHLVGSELYNLYGGEAFSFCNYRFNLGCEHAIAAQMLLDFGIDNLDQAQRNCLELGNYDLPCFHGLGHGLLTWEEFDIHRALSYCETATASDLDIIEEKAVQARVYCHAGVFMEYAWSAPNIQLDQANPMQFCSSFSLDSHRSACALYQPVLIMNTLGWDFARVASECRKGADINIRFGCEKGLGTWAAHLSKGDVNGVREYCALIGEKKKEYSCLIDAAAQTKFQLYYNWKETVAILCNQVPEGDQERCWGEVNSIPTPLNIAFHYNKGERNRAVDLKTQIEKISFPRHQIIEVTESKVIYEADVIYLVNGDKKEAAMNFTLLIGNSPIIGYLEEGETPTEADIIVAFGKHNHE